MSITNNIENGKRVIEYYECSTEAMRNRMTQICGGIRDELDTQIQRVIDVTKHDSITTPIQVCLGSLRDGTIAHGPWDRNTIPKETMYTPGDGKCLKLIRTILTLSMTIKNILERHDRAAEESRQFIPFQ